MGTTDKFCGVTSTFFALLTAYISGSEVDMDGVLGPGHKKMDFSCYIGLLYIFKFNIFYTIYTYYKVNKTKEEDNISNNFLLLDVSWTCNQLFSLKLLTLFMTILHRILNQFIDPTIPDHGCC